jgi:hypothetical protein
MTRGPSVDPMAINASDWCENFYIWWADDHAPGSSDYGYRMKIMDGGMLLFQEKGGEFSVVAPHAWKRIHTAFEFTT